VKAREFQKLRVAFGGALRKFRLKAGLSQEQLAALAGVHRNYVGDVERAEENISLVNILRFCHALEIPLSRLVAQMEKDLQGP